MKKYKLFTPYISPKAIDAVATVLKSGYVAEGEEVALFEKEFSEFFSKPNTVLVNSGTSALELAYDLAKIQEGDEVIAPVLTFIGATIPLIRRKAKLIFADIDPKNFNIDIKDVASKITSNTKAIVFVHFGGNNENLKEINELARKHNIIVIEDAAQAIGSDYWGVSDFTAVSFQAIKMLTCGDGGALICKNSKYLPKAKRLKWFGMDRSSRQKNDFADATELGYKYHMNNIAAAIGRSNLIDIPEIIEHRNKLVNIYNSYKFTNSSQVRLISGVWSVSVISDDRDKLRAYLDQKGIQTGIHHYRNDMYTVCGGKKVKLKNMDELEDKYFLVPIHQNISEKDVTYICSEIDNYFNNK